MGRWTAKLQETPVGVEFVCPECGAAGHINKDATRVCEHFHAINAKKAEFGPIDTRLLDYIWGCECRRDDFTGEPGCPLCKGSGEVIDAQSARADGLTVPAIWANRAVDCSHRRSIRK